MAVLKLTDEFGFKIAIQSESILYIGEGSNTKAPTVINFIGGEASAVKETFDEVVNAWAQLLTNR
jgi:hypothetical protein